MKKMRFVDSCFGISKQENFFRCLVVCVGLLLSVCAWGQDYGLYTLSYTSGRQTYYLAVNNAGTGLTRLQTNRPTIACLWLRVETDGQYTFQHWSTKQYLQVTTSRVSLDDTPAALNIANNKLYLVSGRTNYYLRYNNNAWGVTRQNNGQQFTFTKYQSDPLEISAAFYTDVAFDAQQPLSYLTWLDKNEGVSQWTEQTAVLRITRTDEETYVSEDSRFTITAGMPITTVLSNSSMSYAGANVTSLGNDQFTYTMTSGNLDGENYVEVVGSPVYDAEKKGWVFTFRPTEVNPIRDGADAVRGADGEYSQWLTTLNTQIQHDATDATSTHLYLARATFHHEDVDRARLNLRPAVQRFAYQNHQPQTFTLEGTFESGRVLVRADGTIVESSAAVEEIDVRKAAYSIVSFVDADSKEWDATWLDVTQNGSNVILTALSDNNGDNVRRAVLRIYYQYAEGQGVYLNIPVAQDSRLSNAEGLQLSHQGGMGDLGTTKNDMQLVHTAYTTVYYRPDEELKLYLKERAFLSWGRWFDLDTHQDLGDHYVYDPEYRATDGTIQDFFVFGQGEHTHGRAFFRASDGDDKGGDLSRPIVKYSGEDEHNIACDVSNYTDWTIGEDNITEPTLSYRHIFQLKPASARADELEQYKAKTTSHATRYNAANEVYLEEHIMTAPAARGRAIALAPNFYYADNVNKSARVADYGYIYRDGSGVLHRIGQTGTEKAVWYKNGVAVTSSDGSVISTEQANLFQVAEITSPQTIVYTLETANYNLCRFVVNFRPLEEVGPYRSIMTPEERAERYDVLASRDFNDDNNKPGSTFTIRPKPLEWNESSFGYVYPKTALNNDASLAYNDRRHTLRMNTPPFIVSYGEYALVNKIGSSAYWIEMEQHDETAANGQNAANGYMLYVDGTSEQGLVATLQTEADLCAGQKMYCSAWISNPNKNNGTDPILRFAVEGRMHSEGTGSTSPLDDIWHPVSEYTTGSFIESNGEWQQIMFEIDLAIDYDEYRLSIYNYAADNSGNDFILDDICIFASRRPMAAYQTGSLCDVEYVDAVIRLDYNNMDRSAMDNGGRRMYCNVLNETTGEVMKMNYLNTGADSEYGYIDLPLTDADIPSNEKYASLADFFASTEGETGEFKKVGYVEENVSGDVHWVVYVRHRMPLGLGSDEAQSRYVVRVAYTVDELNNATCAMETYLPVSRAFDLQVNGGIETTPVLLCGNVRYDIKLRMNVVKTEGETTKDMYGMGLNDWIMIPNAADHEGMEVRNDKLVDKNGAEVTILGYTYQQIENALRHDLRQVLYEEGVGNLNQHNYEATTLAEIDPTLMAPANYTLIRDLWEAGLITLASETIAPYVQEGVRIACLIMPIKETGFMVDGDGNFETDEFGNKIAIDQCFFPHVVELYADPSAYELELGNATNDALPEAIQTQPTIVRCSLADFEDVSNLPVAIPIRSIANTTVGPDIELVRTTDPAFDTQTQGYYFSPDKESYQSGDVIRLREHTERTNTGILREGFDYTFKITMQAVEGNAGDNVQVDGQPCAVGEVYFTLRIVPQYLRWHPQSSGTSNWNDDANWAVVDANGNIVEGAKGYVPMGHSNIIIEEQDDDSKYPVLVDPAVYMAEHQGLNAYEVGYTPASCKNIYFEGNAKILNQEYLTYEKAFVDMKFVSNNWHILSAPLQEVYAGDYYTPNNPATDDADPFAPGMFNGNRNYNYAYYQSFYNQEITIIEKEGVENKTLTDIEWSEYVNDMSLRHEVGKGYAVAGFGPTDVEQELVVRLPKSDERYYYYGSYGERLDNMYVDIARSDNRYKFAYAPTDGEMEITLTNNQASKYFVFGNPTMAYINMFDFLQGNGLSTTFRYMDNSNWKTSTPLTASETNDYFLPPKHGVLIEVPEVTTSVMLRLKTAWLTLNTENDLMPMFKPAKTRSSKGVLSIRAVNNEAESMLFLAESAGASDAVIANEDAEAIISTDASTVETPLTVYTSHTGTALNVDVRRQLTTHPVLLAYTQAVADTTELWFAGVEQFDAPIYLVDTIAGTATQLLNGLRIRVATPARGEERYFVRIRDKATDTPTHTDEVEDDDIQGAIETLQVHYSNLSNGEVMVQANATIDHITAYDIVGKEVVSITPLHTTATVQLSPGAYILRTQTQNGTSVEKVIVE